MDINARFLSLALQGSSWVLWLLIAASAIAVAVAAERFLKLRYAAAGQARLRVLALKGFREASEGNSSPAEELERLAARADSSHGPAAAMLRAIDKGARLGRATAEQMLSATRRHEQRVLERYISVLGTIGANAPFVGLFGTVLEILRVFALVGAEGMGGSSQSLAIMGGISEALVATGVGLLVAIPAVIGFNVLTRRVETLMGEADEISEIAFALLEAKEERHGVDTAE